MDYLNEDGTLKSVEEVKAAFEAAETETAKWKAFSRQHEDEVRKLKPKVEEIQKTVLPQNEDLKAELEQLKLDFKTSQEAAEQKLKNDKISAFIKENGLPEQAATFLSKLSDDELDAQKETAIELFAAKKLNPNPLAGTGNNGEVHIGEMDAITADIAKALNAQK